MVHIQRALAWGLPRLINGNEFFMPWLLCLCVKTFISFYISVLFSMCSFFFFLLFVIWWVFLAEMSICILMTGCITGLRFFAFAHWCYFYLETDVSAAGKKKKRREMAYICVHIEPFSSD